MNSSIKPKYEKRTKPPVLHYRKCVRCGETTDDDRYNCSCKDAEWTNEYRLTDICFELNKTDIQRALQAFKSYDMNHPAGMLQYILLPHLDMAVRFKLQVGLTPFFKLPVLSDLFARHIYVKDEGRNPGGSFKDRESTVAALHSLATGKQRAIIYSSGNAAASAAICAAHLNIRLITCVSGDTYPEKVEYIRQTGTDVIRVGDSKTNYEQGYRLFSQLNNNGFYESLGLDNWSVRNPFRVSGDKTTAIEIVRQFGEISGSNAAVPDYVVVPTGNGSCLAGIWKGFHELKNIGAIDKLPKMVSAAIKNASPVYKAFQKKLRNRPAVCDLNRVPENDLKIGSVIVAEEGYDSVAAANALYESNGTALVVTRGEVKQVLTSLFENEWATTNSHDFLPEPASLVALAAAKKMKDEKIGNERSSVVAVITGHGSKAVQILQGLLKERDDLSKKLHHLAGRKGNTTQQTNATKYGELLPVDAEQSDIENAVLQLCLKYKTIK